VCGTFDVENYGDCLFPVVAAHRLSQAGHTITAVSPTNVKTRWADAYPPVAVSDIGAIPDLSAVIIGGGNIVHNHAANLATYIEAGVDETAYVGLWAGSTIAGVMRKVPVAWNAPGVPRKFNAVDAKYLVPSHLAAADYVAVRDEASKAALGRHHKTKLHIVPDTAVEISNAWPEALLEPIFNGVLDRLSAPRSERYITIHVKKRALGDEVESLVTGIEGLCSRLSAVPILVGLAPCHDDDDAVRAMSARLSIPHVMLDNALSLKEIAASIAMSDAYIGPSLHGYITSYSYGVPSALVARPKLAKFLGFTEQVGRSGDVVETWDEALSQIEARIGRPFRTAETDSFLTEALDAHWGQIIEMIDVGARVSAAHRLNHILYSSAERAEDAPPSFRKFVKRTLQRAGLR
jgi:polysaccharide pyruvyl transferase WcaK-like protein